jgi:hypothetical protein
VICACGSRQCRPGAAASRKRGESRGGAGEECPHEWGHGSLEGYATVGRAGRESDQIRDRQKLQENWLAGECACPTPTWDRRFRLSTRRKLQVTPRSVTRTFYLFISTAFNSLRRNRPVASRLARSLAEHDGNRRDHGSCRGASGD